MQPLTTLESSKYLIAPSLLAADFAILSEQLKQIEANGADMLHFDVMDGHFVPNLSMGPGVSSSIKKCCKLPFDVHLMVTNPGNYISPFVKAGADHITFHIECNDNINDTIDSIHATGCSAGLSLRPKTPASAVLPYLHKLDLILVMTVEPGFGGQAFMVDQLPKIKEIRAMINESKRPIHLEVDGGIDKTAAPLVQNAGANILVAGSSIFRHPDGIAKGIASLRK